MKKLTGLASMIGMHKDDAKNFAMDAGFTIFRIVPIGEIRTLDWWPGRVTLVHDEAGIVTNACFA